MTRRRAGSFVPALLLVLAVLGGCADRHQTAARIAEGRALRPDVVATRLFHIATWRPAAFTPGAPLAVYIEGDGRAWITATRVSGDPTPRDPVALELAARDRRPNVVYIARPCQYVTGAQRRNCSPAFWTNARFAEQVVAATDAVIGHYKRQAAAPAVRLYGYSGGGTLAALVAARRDDVAWLATVGAVLDHAHWTRLEGLTPLTHSLNPADAAPRLARIPQVHYVGADDTVVPPRVARAFQQRFPAGARPAVVVVPNADHLCCWTDAWPSLLRREP